MRAQIPHSQEHELLDQPDHFPDVVRPAAHGRDHINRETGPNANRLSLGRWTLDSQGRHFRQVARLHTIPRTYYSNTR
jgi:hypothetical protein